jgi:hypothetical protein
MKVIIGLPLSLALLFLLQLHLAVEEEGGRGHASTSMVYSTNNAVVLPNVVRMLNTMPRIVGGEPAAKGEFKVRRSLMPD